MLNVIKKLLFFVLLAVLVGHVSKKQSQVKKPNVLFILVDDFGYSDLSCMGSDFYETPNIDAIAQKGMIFTNGYAGCQVCSPSRGSIMTGQFTARHGITDWIGSPEGEAWRLKQRNTKMLPPSYEHHLNKKDVTMPMAFKANGYMTFFAGKWHLGDEGYYPEDFGFDINKGGYHRGGPAGGFFAPFNNPKLENHEKGENLSKRLADETIEFMKAPKDKPFFAFLSFYAVHAPIQTTQEKWNKYRNKAEEMGIAEQGFEAGDLKPARRYQDNPVYAGLVESMDDAVGLVMKALKDNGLDKNTIVVFTSDNGGVVSGDNYSTSCMPLRGGKGYQWEGGIRIPYILNVPWMKHSAQRNATPVAGSDLYPTLLDLAGLPLLPQNHVDGQSIVPVLEGKSFDERPLYWHYPHYGNQGGRPASSVRLGDWKLIHFWEDGHNELYNLISDIHEDNDLSETEVDRVESMSHNLLSWLDQVGAKYPIVDVLYDEAKSKIENEKRMDTALKNLEKQRVDMLTQDWKPNSTWWGSVID